MIPSNFTYSFSLNHFPPVYNKMYKKDEDYAFVHEDYAGCSNLLKENSKSEYRTIEIELKR